MSARTRKRAFVHRLLFITRSGHQGSVVIDAATSERMHRCIDDEDYTGFLGMDSADGWQWFINTKHLLSAQLIFDAEVAPKFEKEDRRGVHVRFVNGVEKKFPHPNEEYRDEKADPPLTPAGYLAAGVEIEYDAWPQKVMAYVDEDGEMVFIRMADVEILRIGHDDEE